MKMSAARPARARRRRPRRPRARRGRPRRSRRDGPAAPAGHRRASSTASAALPADELVEARYRRYRAIGRRTLRWPRRRWLRRPTGGSATGCATCSIRPAGRAGTPIPGRVAPRRAPCPRGGLSACPDDRDPAAPPRRARDDAARAADHAGIDRLADDARCPPSSRSSGASARRARGPRGRLADPPAAAGGRGRDLRPSRDRPAARGPSRATNSTATRPRRRSRTARRATSPSAAAAATDGSGGPASPRSAGRAVEPAAGSGRDPTGADAGGSAHVATSPAVGVFQPRREDRRRDPRPGRRPPRRRRHARRPPGGRRPGRRDRRRRSSSRPGTAVEYGQELRPTWSPRSPAEGR